MASKRGKLEVDQTVDEDASQAHGDEEEPTELPVEGQVDVQHELYISQEVVHACCENTYIRY